MSIFTKHMSQLGTDDLAELLQDEAVENVRLEFKSKVPEKLETLKKLSSFANSFGGFMVIGAKARSTDGRIEELQGVDEQPGFKQKVVQWCFDAVNPPLIVEVSDPIPAAIGSKKSCYVIHTAESEVAPHFLNGRKGVWVRSDEFSQRYEPQLAMENEIRHLLDRRLLIQQRRIDLVDRSKGRYERFIQRHSQGVIDAAARRDKARLEMSFGPRFPARTICTQAILVEALKTCRFNWRQVGFPPDSSSLVSQHESALRLNPGNTDMLIEANVWGMLFYGIALPFETNSGLIPGINLYSFVGHLLVFAKHAIKILADLSYEGPVVVEVVLTNIFGIPWVYRSSGIPTLGPVSELDNAFSFSLPTTTEELRESPDALVMSLLQYTLFGINWADMASKPEILKNLLVAGYQHNLWGTPFSQASKPQC